ncbi:MAG: TraE/TraK family type IV conjugative transfer system protein [Nitrosopumilus sp.]
MKAENFRNNIQYLKFQRNVFSSLAFLMAIALSVISCFLFLREEKVIIIPHNLEKSVWVKGQTVSPSYLEQQALFLSQLLLSKTPSSTRDQNGELLRHTSPNFFGTLQEKLQIEEKMIREQGSSFVFFLKTSEVFPDKMQVKLSGDRHVYLGGKVISCSKEECILSFKMTGQIPLLDGVEIKNESL